MNAWFARYGKSVALFAGAVIIVAKNVVADGGITGDEWFVIATAVVGGIATYIAPNLTGGVGKWTKALVFAASIIIGALPAMLPDGLTPAEWFDLVVLLATQFGVIILPAPKHPTGPTP
jgi:hypothetical protein